MLRSVPIRGATKEFNDKQYYFFNSYNPTATGSMFAKRDAKRLRSKGIKARVVMESAFPVIYTRPKVTVDVSIGK